MVRCLGTVTGLFAGMMAGLACVVLGLLAFVAAPDAAPQASRDPVARFDLAIVSPPEVNADPPVYQPMSDRLKQVGLFAVNAHSTLPDLARLAAPTGSIIESWAARGMAGILGDDPRLDRTEIRRVAGMELFDILSVVALKEGSSTIESRAARGMAGTHGDDPRLDLPEPGPDEPFRSEEVSKSPAVPHPGNVGGALPRQRPQGRALQRRERRRPRKSWPIFGPKRKG